MSFLFKTFLYLCNIFPAFAQESYIINYKYITLAKESLLSTLVISGNESTFKILDDRQEGWTYKEDGNKDLYIVNDELSTFCYSDGQTTFVRIPSPKSIGGAVYFYSEELLNWQITGNTKKIKSYNCQEAKLELHGRFYTAWFTTDIPIHKGPLKLHGLPGLIVEVEEKNGLCKIKLLDLKKTSDIAIINQSKAYFESNKVMSFSEYEAIVKELAIRSKIKIANYMAEDIAENGGSINVEFPNGNYYFVRRIIDIPEGTIKELEKIDL